MPRAFVVVAPAIVSSLLLVAVYGVIVHRGRGDVGGLIDATLVALAVGGLIWTIIEPYIQGQYRSPLARVTVAVVLLALAGAIGALLRLVETDTQHIAVLPLLLTALLCNLGGFVLIRTRPDEAAQLIGLMLYMTAYLALGLASVDPTMALLADAATPVPDRLGWARLLMLGTALAAVPAAAGVTAVIGGRVDVGFLIAAVLATVPLVMLRIGLLARELHRAERGLRYLATHDPLTGVLNRRAFTDRLVAELASSRDCVLVFCDLNSFKAINDRLGHTAGDQLLVGVADRLRSQMRQDDVVGRYGGDEFLILFHDTHASDAERLCSRLADAFHQPFVLDRAETALGVSIGAVASEATSTSTHPRSVTELIRQADAAMYASKHGPPSVGP